MDGSFSHGSGTMTIIACASECPAMWMYSRQLSNIAESLPVSSTTGKAFTSSGSFDGRDLLSRAFSQLIFPLIVLISPLWTM